MLVSQTNLSFANFITGGSAWTPQESTYYQFLTLDLGDQYEIRSIVTQGLSKTQEYVTEYIVQFSDDGEGWRSYSNPQGETEVRFLFLTLNRPGVSVRHVFKFNALENLYFLSSILFFPN